MKVAAMILAVSISAVAAFNLAAFTEPYIAVRACIVVVNRIVARAADAHHRHALLFAIPAAGADASV